jgi:hypothetical protein
MEVEKKNLRDQQEHLDICMKRKRSLETRVAQLQENCTPVHIERAIRLREKSINKAIEKRNRIEKDSTQIRLTVDQLRRSMMLVTLSACAHALV